MRVLVLIVNYRTPELTFDCLRSLADERASFPELHTVVVENGSGDSSAEEISAAIAREGWTWVTLRALSTNLGFAGGNNAGIECAKETGDVPEYVLLLNSDTVVRPSAIQALVDFLDSHPKVGIAGSRLEDPDGTYQLSTFRFMGIASELEAAISTGLVTRVLGRWMARRPLDGATCRVDWLAGASFMVRREVLDTVGLLDPGYFMYFEEMDLCLRAARAGWQTWYVSSSRVVHLVGRSSGVTRRDTAPKRLPAYWFESRRRFFIRNYGRVYACLVDLGWLIGHLFLRARYAVERRAPTWPPHVLRDFLRHSALRKGIQDAGARRSAAAREIPAQQ